MKSKIIQDCTQVKISLETTLNRLKVILFSLSNDNINQWINNEINGYGEKDKLPDYRIITGIPIGSMMTFGGLHYTRRVIPLSNIDEKIKERMINKEVTEGIQVISDMVNQDNKIGIPISLDVCDMIARLQFENVSIDSLSIEFSKNEFQNILTKVRSKCLDILLNLENEFGNLDNYDVIDNAKKEDKQKIIIKIEKLISINDKNKITHTNF